MVSYAQASDKMFKGHGLKKLLKKFKWILPALGLFSKITLAVVVVLAAYNLLFIGRIFPNVFIAGADISGLTPEEASRLLTKNLTLPNKLDVTSGGQNYEIDLANINLHYDLELTSYSAYNLFRTGNPVYDFGERIKSLWQKRNLGVRLEYDETKLDETISVLAGQIAIEPVYPEVKYDSNQIVVITGTKGQDVDINEFKMNVEKAISELDTKPLNIAVKTVDPTLTRDQADALKQRAEKFIGKKLTLNFEFQTFNHAEKELLPLLLASGGYKTEAVNNLIASISKSIERTPQNPSFVFEEGRVKEFAPAKPGIAIDPEKAYTTITEKLTLLETTEDKTASADIPVKATAPDTKTEDVNNLGIKELIGRGTSKFAGSIPSRIFNVNLAATRISGVLIKPGEEFSFVNTIGDISKLTGYKEAYVIKDGKTVLGDGGGVCQVSTTLFRAVMNAGLPITERRAHAYRVGYYEQDSGPGLDATIYSPTTDFKFKNDTPNHILIQAYPDTKNYSLIFELYGTSDGRIGKTTKPVTTNISAPPEDSYVDDPTLPVGVVKQIEHKAFGAKSTFDYEVTRGGEVIYQKTFVSNYRAWQAVYLRGTGGV